MIAYIQQEEVALNRRRNKVDMEKVFATVISLAIMVALVVGELSIHRRNKSEGENKQNYIDLNQINEALNETEQNTQKQTESREAQTNVARNDEKNSADDKKNIEEPTTKGNDGSIAPTKEGVEAGERDVAKNTDEKGQKDTENVTEVDAEPVSEPSVEPGTEVAVQPSEPEGIEVAQLPSEEGNTQTEVTNTSMSGDVGEAAPVNASTATILGYNFNEESTMMWPAVGNVILNYNMTNTIYFPTLDVYRCNPAIIISAPEDSVVSAAADGLVIAVYETNETGLTMEIALGNDYVMTYGQLKNLMVGVGSQVKRGDVLGAVAAPSQYYTVEGSNLYF